MAKGTGGPSGDECQNLIVGTIDCDIPKQGCATVAVAHAFYSTGGTHGLEPHPNICPPLKIGSALGIPSPPAVCTAMIVRRLTPVECERLQGFPDGWTQIGTDKPTADTHRYKQLGNAVTVNVAEWIARRTMAWLT